jgi:hypothetical protein
MKSQKHKFKQLISKTVMMIGMMERKKKSQMIMKRKIKRTILKLICPKSLMRMIAINNEFN